MCRRRSVCVEGEGRVTFPTAESQMDWNGNIFGLSQSIGSCVRFNGPHNTGEALTLYYLRVCVSPHTLLRVCVGPHTLQRGSVGPHTLLRVYVVPQT